MIRGARMFRRLTVMATTTTRHKLPESAPRSHSLVEPVAAVWSVLVAALGALWLAVPRLFPDVMTRPDDYTSPVAFLPSPVVSGALLAFGTVGAVAVTAGSHLGTRRPPVWLGAVAAAYAVVFGLVATDLTLLTFMGYACAILGPPALVVVLAVLAVRRPGARWALGGLGVVAVAAAVGFGVRFDDVGTFLQSVGQGIARQGIHLLVVLVAAGGGALWTFVALRSAGVRRHSGQPAAYTRPRRDLGWWLTVVAICGPLPYGLLRMTWLTPWPVGIPVDALRDNPYLRVFGLCLGLAALGGAVLTSGLISRWGAVYPRWFPGVGGRAVSPTWPAVLATVVGVAVTVAGRSMVQMAIADHGSNAELLFILPFPLWGPCLVGAAYAYYRRRTRTALR